MSTDFDSFSNRGEYLSAFYFAEQLGDGLKKGVFATWANRESDEHDPRPTPRESVRALRSTYLDEKYRGFFAEQAKADEQDDEYPEAAAFEARLNTYGDAEWCERVQDWHRQVLAALGFPSVSAEATARTLTVHRAGREHEVTVAWHSDGIVALDCGWSASNDTALDADGYGRLLHPLRAGSGESYETGQALATWLFQSELREEGGAAPRFVLLLCGGVIVLADRHAWGEGRYLSVNLDAALERNDRRQHGELATIAGLFSHDVLTPAEDGKPPAIDALAKASRDNAVGVSGELREGLQRSVEIIANAVLDRLEDSGLDPRDIERPDLSFARQLTRESLRYLYRILFLLYAEARPELGILPADDGSYEAGYSMARLRELVERDELLTEETARNGFHLHASLDVLFKKVNNGYRPYGTEPNDDLPGDDEDTRRRKAKYRSEDRGLRFEPLRSELFERGSVRLIGNETRDPRSDEDNEPRWLDLRPRNSALHEVLRLLTLKKAERAGGRAGFISYRNLGINQLGAVYEGLMSYTGIIAEEELCEVAKGGDPAKGSWLVPSQRLKEYPENTWVTYDDRDAVKGLRGPKKYPPGRFVYRLAGRDRETSASYYTPESLTKVTVELALKHRLDQERDADGNVVKTRASELLKYRICEPALGSGAFLNEAINQVAEEYLRRRQDELGVSVPTGDALTEKQKAKAYIALHNAYGVDLNATGVELAEVSMWLNTMHPGMRAPWFGLHLRRGNSLIGGRRAVYAAGDVAPLKGKAPWLNAKPLAPEPLPFLKGGAEQLLPDGAVHQFLLPTPGWAAVTGASGDAKKLLVQLAEGGVKDLAEWKKGILKTPTRRLNKKTGEPILDRKSGEEAASQYTRLRDAAQRAEFLWSLVVKRMELSEREIARSIEVWGADTKDEEFAFLRRSEGDGGSSDASAVRMSKEKVYADLFRAAGTPYWRLKRVMDAWCALWFWPVGKAGLLDGSNDVYAGAPVVGSEGAGSIGDLIEAMTATVVPLGDAVPPIEAASATEAGVAPPPSPPMPTSAPRFVENTMLFAMEGDQISMSDIEASSGGVVHVEVREVGPSKTTVKTRKQPSLDLSRPARRPLIALKDLDDWLDFLEAMLGRGPVPDAGSLIGSLNTLEELSDYEQLIQDETEMDMDQWEPEARFPWMGAVRDIAEDQGFLHWELDFALAFAEGGGFDLQVGNPPWVRPEWKENSVIAELEPWFMLTERPAAAEKHRRRTAELARPKVAAYALGEVTSTVTTADYLAAPQVYPLIAGSQPDLYRAFMCQVWAHTARAGCAGMVHPDTHFNGDKEATLREAAYRRLRMHGDFVNSGNRFFPPPVGRSSHFGVHIYGEYGEIDFQHLSWLFSVDAFRLSGAHDGTGDAPGVKFDGGWDERAHRKRVVRVTPRTLDRWQRLSGEQDVPVEQARLLTPVSTAEDSAIDALAAYPLRLGALDARITRGFDESGAKKSVYGPDGDTPLIDYNKGQKDREDYQAASWADVILKGPQLGVANPFFKQPSQGGGEVLGLNHIELASDAVPESEYRRVADKATYLGAQDRWLDQAELERLRRSEETIRETRARLAEVHKCAPGEITSEEVDKALVSRATKPYTAFYRMAWREMIAPDTERSLYSALIPREVVHVDLVHSAYVMNTKVTALTAGFWSGLPVDYSLRTSGTGHLKTGRATRMPAPSPDHPLTSALLLRTLRLNCLTTAYADLWQELYDPAWSAYEPWARDWPQMETELLAVTPTWQRGTPLRSEYARRAALVEIDALVAVWLGIDADTLVTMYRARFPIMQDFDSVSWFDSTGRKIAGNRYTFGHGQTSDHWKALAKYQEGQKDTSLPEAEKPPAPDGYTAPFYKADRETEMREAHAYFQKRLDAAVEACKWDPATQEVPKP
ncbi:hypothetical protein QR77_32760 [Streptomyces sp. 150FB]|uniref:hypothetical protein n=1 Tax=Streptomyces sp. 150FB TaxID=1576605 RepID=UPI000588FD50|nr:hypothetical protein [Streptomyces sp. 150FB]KIF77343.1 hypothetical protein QR77_32760 [Streptomyces sp. 150FB]